MTLFVLSCGRAGDAGQLKASEYEVKAAYLVYFARFTDWPASVLGAPDRPLVFGVLGDDPFGQILDDTVRGKSVAGRALVVRRLASIEEAAGCHLLFIASSEKRHLTRVVEGVSRSGLLTVADTDRFAARGGVIELVNEGDRVGVVVNTDAATRAGLRISSKLLSVAQRVGDRQGGAR